MAPDVIYFDGTCGLCHRTVRFCIRHDSSGGKFRYAPLEGVTFRERGVGRRIPEGLDSVVVVTSDDRVLIRSDAVLHLLRRLGGLHRVFAVLVSSIPRGLRDGAYRGVAFLRNRWSGAGSICPISGSLRGRFLP